mgnify:CR=1 FL=1
MSAITKIFGTHSERELKRIYPLVDKVESYREAMGALSDEELKNKTKEYKERLENGETLDDLLPEAYATVREAAKRVLGMEHYRVQIIGGIILHQGRIAEMKTGEGKTLVSTLPAYLNALEGKGVCIVTVNDYLAKRDSEWMGQVHEFLGLKVGVVLNEMTNDERRDAYNCDITYVTNNELGFDYLRDNMVIYKEQLVQRGLHFAIIDEVDSVLIDEARTPLIISGQSGKSTRLYEACDILACQMKRGEDMPEYSKMDAIMGVEQEETGDFIVNEKDKVVSLTQDGVKKVEQFFKIGNLADPENLEIQHNIILALRAHNLMFRDQDYVVKDDQVMIVDEFTGRIMPGRRYSDGLHQAIEAKEHVKVKRESKTLATITFQNFFNKFEKKAGMTGTALTEEKEFRDIYGMDVVEIPTNRPIARIDHHDVVYKTKNEKYKAVVEEVVKSHEKGQPVLVGTINIDTSELISGMLKREGIPHTVLNAKFHEKEAEIVAGAGQHGVATATVAAMMGMECEIYMGEEDTIRQALNVYRMRLLGAKVHPVKTGTATLKDAVSEAFREWTSRIDDTHYVLGSVMGPYPFPEIVRDFQAVISKEIKAQLMEKEGRLPDVVMACVGGGSNAIGAFYDFIPDESVRLIGCEAAGRGVDTFETAATIATGKLGIFHGMKSYFCQDEFGQIAPVYSISAGLDYPGIGPEHAYLHDIGRAEYVAITDDEAVDAFEYLSRIEGIIPAIESAHAVAYAMKLAPTMDKDKIIVINVSGRGDKDVAAIARYRGEDLHE